MKTMTDPEIITAQANIIERQSRIISELSELAQDTLSTLAQYQTVDAEEQRFREIGKEELDG